MASHRVHGLVGAVELGDNPVVSTTTPEHPWWVTALVAALIVGALSAFALYLPPSRATIVLLLAATTFVVVLRHNPAFWMRRLAGGCIGAALVTGLAPEFHLALNADGLAVLLRDGGHSVPLAIIFGVLGIAFAVLDRRSARAAPAAAVEIGGDLVAGDKHENHFHPAALIASSTASPEALEEMFSRLGLAKDPRSAITLVIATFTAQARQGGTGGSGSTRVLAVILLVLALVLALVLTAFVVSRARPRHSDGQAH